MKKLVIFDLDDTLSDSKKDVTYKMSSLLLELCSKTKVAVISGCSWNQMSDQLCNNLINTNFMKFKYDSSFYFLPTSGAQMWLWDNHPGDFVQYYSNELTLREKVKIYVTFDDLYRTELMFFDYKWGEIAEDRGSQITFSLLGQNAPLEAKKTFDPGGWGRRKLAKAMEERLKGFEVKVGGTTSIDVTKSGINKAYGIQRLLEYINKTEGQSISIDDVVYVGDALQEGGNDAIVKTIGVETIETKDPKNTEEIIRSLLEKDEKA